jgi:hypothetical protein
MILTEGVVNTLASALKRRCRQYPGTSPNEAGVLALADIATAEEPPPGLMREIVWDAACRAVRQVYGRVSSGDRAHYSAGEVAILASCLESDPASETEVIGRADLEAALTDAPRWVLAAIAADAKRGSSAWRNRRTAVVWLAWRMSGYDPPDTRTEKEPT